MPGGTKQGSPVLRTLGIFWGTVLVLTAMGAVTLQALGPPPRIAAGTAAGTAPAPQTTMAPGAAMAPPPAGTSSSNAPAPHFAAAGQTATPRPGAAIPEADPALTEPSQSFPGASLPRIAQDGRPPMQVYRAGYDRSAKGPRIALMLADFGMNEQDSDEASRSLPPAVSFAVSPYASQRAVPLVAAAHARGHETLAALPLEPQGYPDQADAGDHALLTGAKPGENAKRLEWSLSRFTSYAGATAALGRLHGERYAQATVLYATLLEEIARRGLFYIDPRPEAVALQGRGLPPFKAVDVVVDAPAIRTQIDAQLARLEQVAQERGSALGLASGPAPVTLDRLAAWTAGLSARGFVLVPVSALILDGPSAP